MRMSRVLMCGAVLVAGCSNDPTKVVTSTDGLTRVTVISSSTSSVMFAASDPFVPVNGTVVIAPEAAAQAALAAAGNYYTPASCLQVSAQGASVTYVLNSCNGPLGVTGMTGTYTVTYSQGTNGVTIDITSNAFTVGGASLAVAAQGFYSQNGTGRSLSITSQGSATNDDNKFVQVGQTTTLVWNQGDTCATENANGTVLVNGVAFNQASTNVVRCLNSCPSGGTVVLSDSAGTVATVNYNGSTSASFSTPSNQTGTVIVSCTVAAH